MKAPRLFSLLVILASVGVAAELRVPAQVPTIQAAIDAAKPGDTVLVAAGTYRERLKLAPGVFVKSQGDDTKGALGLKRAEATILDGAGVEMAEGATLDGFTVTGVGKYDDVLWQHHFDTRGNEQQHEHIGQPGTPGVAVNYDCSVLNNVVHHIGYTGIAITSGSPRVAGNVCYRNMGGGIGAMSGAAGVIENNVCFENFHAGIGHSGASPLVRGNTCHDNVRAGIGISEGASPTVAGNRCYKNRRAGIGIRTGKDTRPVVEGNECFDNDMAGIGVEEGARPKLTRNRVLNNKLVAIGVSGGADALIEGNELAREGGVPPMIAVLEKSSAVITSNTIRGGGVAAILLKGRAAIRGNHFITSDPKAKNAIWVQSGAEVTLGSNKIEGWKQELAAAKDAKIVAQDKKPAARPNILWLTAEDMSPNLGCYGDTQARTPRLDAFARESVRFTRAFATAPVCSPSRSCLITGMFATSLGTQRLRSAFPVPAEFAPFTAGLRAAGYYCSNNVKTDYNLRDEPAFIRAAWDDSSTKAHWRSRPAEQPFFSVFNFMTTHQSRTSAWPQEQFEKEVGAQLSPGERHDPARMTPPPFYPQTEEARRAWARYHDSITLMDRQAGEILDQLAADGLADDTIVFFYSDHGMGMPRGKRCLHDSGLRVPLLVRFPKNWAHLAPSPPGGTTDRLVSFVDFAPTVLSLCGVKTPAHFQGSAFLGPDAAAPREFIHGARDRVDEAFDVSRSVRDARWLYIRNYMPHLPWLQPEGYSNTSPFRREMQRLAPRIRANEELYDTQTDPDNLRNLAADPRHRATLEKMRAELRRWQLSTRDAGFFTEPQMWARLDGKETPWSIAHDDARYPLAQILDVAEAVPQRERLRDADECVRYWTAVGLHALASLNDADREALRGTLRDASAAVRIEAAAALAQHGDSEFALPVLASALRDERREVVLHAARALELLGPSALPAHDAMRAALSAAREGEQRGDPIAMFIRFSLEAAIAR